MPWLAFAHDSVGEESVVIHMTEAGYEPAALTIPVGTTVIFENIATTESWPASDDHPTHEGYDGTSLYEHCHESPHPTFDSCGGIAPGATWQFTFDTAGTFAYHDHLRSHLGGVITVTELAESSTGFWSAARAFFNDLWQRLTARWGANSETDVAAHIAPSDRYSRLQDEYETLVREQDPAAAIAALQQASLEDEYVLGLCHDLLHQIGRTAYDRYGSFESAIVYQSDFCNSGYIHGVFEGYFSHAVDPLLGLSEQCASYAAERGRAFDAWQCYHGVGHGFMYLLEGDLDASLALCGDEFAGANQASCENGVYMEVFNAEVLAKEDAYVDPNNLFATCRDRSTAKQDCYLYAPTYLSSRLDMAFEDMFAVCTEAGPEYEHICAHGVGSEAMKRTMQHPDEVFTLCESAGSWQNQQSCVMGLVGIYLNQTASLEATRELCTSAPAAFRLTCNLTVENRARLLE